MSSTEPESRDELGCRYCPAPAVLLLEAGDPAPAGAEDRAVGVCTRHQARGRAWCAEVGPRVRSTRLSLRWVQLTLDGPDLGTGAW